MKKLKFMLLSFALLAVVGGALAFKTKFQAKYCIHTTNGLAAPFDICTITEGPDVGNKYPCNDPVFSTTVQAQDVFCTTKDNDLIFDCKKNGVQLLCNTTTKLKND